MIEFPTGFLHALFLEGFRLLEVLQIWRFVANTVAINKQIPNHIFSECFFRYCINAVQAQYSANSDISYLLGE